MITDMLRDTILHLQQEEYQAALTQLRQAERNFEQADREYVDVAIHDLIAAEKRYAAALRELRERASQSV